MKLFSWNPSDLIIDPSENLFDWLATNSLAIVIGNYGVELFKPMEYTSLTILLLMRYNFIIYSFRDLHGYLQPLCQLPPAQKVQ
jgi:hypothetical protein